MIRTSLYAAALCLAIPLVGCADDPTATGGLPGSNKPSSKRITTPTSVIAEFGEAAPTETGCFDCTIIHTVTHEGDFVTFFDPSGAELCQMVVGPHEVIANDSCAALAISPPLTAH